MKFVVVCLVILHFAVQQSYSQDCTKQNICECVFDDGSGYDLRSLVGKDNFIEATTDKNVTFFYSPCGDTRQLPKHNFTLIDNECQNGYMLCMFNMTELKMKVLGSEADMEFKMNGENMEMIFVEPQLIEKHSVTLECVPKTKIDVLYAQLEISIHLSLYSKYSCRRHLEDKHSFFYMFFVILLTLLLLLLFVVLWRSLNMTHAYRL